MAKSNAITSIKSCFFTLTFGAAIAATAGTSAFAEPATNKTVPEFPALPRDGDHLGIPDTMTIAVQEDVFVQRELLEGFLGENRIATTTAPDYAEQLRVMGKLGPAARPIDVDRARWRMERIALTGEIGRRMAEMALKYEEINLIKLQVLADQKVPRENLLRLQLETRTMAAELAGLRLKRAELDERFYSQRLREIQYLADRGMVGLEDLLTETISTKQSKAIVATEMRRVALTRAALEIVKRQAASH